MHINKEKKADTRTEKIIMALKEKDKDSLKSLFSKKALNEAKNFESNEDYLFEFLIGNINTWKRDSASVDESIEYGKKSTMLRYGISVSTDNDDYDVFVIDYVKDTINPDNEGIYMLEFSRKSYSGEWKVWQERKCAGISFLE